jgi:hypothetical protein
MTKIHDARLHCRCATYLRIHIKVPQLHFVILRDI